MTRSRPSSARAPSAARPVARRWARGVCAVALAGLAVGCADSADGPSARACARLADADLPSLLGGQIQPPEERVDDAPDRRIYISTCTVRRVHGRRTLSLMLREQRRPDMPLASEQLRRLQESLARDAPGDLAWVALSGIGEAASWSARIRQLIVIDDEGRRTFMLSVGPGGDPLVVAQAAARAALD